MFKKRELPEKMKKKMWKPGVSGNPEGGRAHNPAIKALKNLTIKTYREMIELVLIGDIEKLERISESKKRPAIQVGIAKAFLKAIRHGDYNVIEQIASRIVGKIPDEVHVKSTNLNAEIGKISKKKLQDAMKDLEDEF